MLVKLVAVSLVVLAVSPFTAPFSSCKVGEIFGSRPSKRQALNVAAAHTAAALQESPRANERSGVEIRTGVAVCADRQTASLSLPVTRTVTAAVRARGQWFAPSEDQRGAPAHARLSLRL